MSSARLSRFGHRLRVLEAAALLSIYPLVTRIVPLPRLLRLLGIAIVPASGENHRVGSLPARAVGFAVEAAACRLPWRPLCLPQATVAGTMLRLRRYRPSICFGARRAEDGLSAHAWLVLDGPDGGIVSGGAPVGALSPFGHLPEMQSK
jgi:hypothetical protein